MGAVVFDVGAVIIMTIVTMSIAYIVADVYVTAVTINVVNAVCHKTISKSLEDKQNCTLSIFKKKNYASNKWAGLFLIDSFYINCKTSFRTLLS